MSKHGETPGMLLTEVAVFNLPEVVALLVTEHLISYSVCTLLCMLVRAVFNLPGDCYRM